MESINKGFKSLKVYQLAYLLALEIFEISKHFPKDCKYINEQLHESFIMRYEEVGKMLGSMADNPGKFKPK